MLKWLLPQCTGFNFYTFGLVAVRDAEAPANGLL